MSSSKQANHVNDDVNFDYKLWNQRKATFEDSLIKNLKSSISSGSVPSFVNYIADGVNELEALYSVLPGGSNGDESQLHRNKKLRTFFGEMCKTDVEGGFLVEFLVQIPVSNESIPQLANQYPLHIAIGAGAFTNVETLLNLPNTNANVLWKKQTPLMLLFKVTKAENFPLVMKLVYLLASKQADINIGDYTKHPLSVVCGLTTITDAQKHELLTLCFELFKCDVDSFFNGQARRDVTALLPDFVFEAKRAEISLEMMKSLLLAGIEDMFIDELDEFIQTRRNSTNELAELLMLASSKGRSQGVEAILSKSANNEELIKQIDKLSKVLKIVCSKGYPQVLELFLLYISQPAVFNERPLALTCVQRLYRARTAELEECLGMLLVDPRVSIELCDHLGRTALNFARQHEMNQEVFSIVDNEAKSLIRE
ncbi:uncharacterized protein LOC120430696 [Culex pipiens pallens]|uniref:uncharacterized protein LOC120430696 n=1 Tax=Culex pipiens pallens TaxID=42434 RepID=UPI001952E342|nr:uncharacterized protein LOC120430696 [Culex pipiens pallens]